MLSLFGGVAGALLGAFIAALVALYAGWPILISAWILIAACGVAIAVEIFAWSERNSGTKLAKALKRPGYEIQRLVGTREPSEEQLEVGRAALDEILRVEAAGS